MDQNYNEIYAISEVYYIINKLDKEVRNKIPNEIYEFFMENSDYEILKDLDITNDNIENITNEAKVLLKLIDIYIN